MNVLKTQCTGCIFNNSGCALNKSVRMDGRIQYTDGYCRHKRNANWKPKEHLDLISGIQSEESLIGVIILSLDNNIEKIKETIINLRQCSNGLIREIVVATKLAPIETIKTLIKVLTAMLKEANIIWSINDAKSEEEVHYGSVIDECSRFIKSNWFMSIRAGDKILPSNTKYIKYIMSIKTDNFLAFYFNETDNIKVLTSKNAFLELKGNMLEPWFEKVKSFNNWKEICHMIV
jgi:hypothetical protein